MDKGPSPPMAFGAQLDPPHPWGSLVLHCPSLAGPRHTASFLPYILPAVLKAGLVSPRQSQPLTQPSQERAHTHQPDTPMHFSVPQSFQHWVYYAPSIQTPAPRGQGLCSIHHWAAPRTQCREHSRCSIRNISKYKRTKGGRTLDDFSPGNFCYL